MSRLTWASRTPSNTPDPPPKSWPGDQREAPGVATWDLRVEVRAGDRQAKVEGICGPWGWRGGEGTGGAEQACLESWEERVTGGWLLELTSYP